MRNFLVLLFAALLMVSCKSEKAYKETLWVYADYDTDTKSTVTSTQQPNHLLIEKNDERPTTGNTPKPVVQEGTSSSKFFATEEPVKAQPTPANENTKPYVVPTPQPQKTAPVYQPAPQPQKQQTFGSQVKYHIIVGSLTTDQAANTLRNKLVNSGFYNSSLIYSDNGRIRVSAATFSDKQEAQKELTRIRQQYPAYKDAWVLEAK